jgi:hypothetical protein
MVVLTPAWISVVFIAIWIPVSFTSARMCRWLSRLHLLLDLTLSQLVLPLYLTVISVITLYSVDMIYRGFDHRALCVFGP